MSKTGNVFAIIGAVILTVIFILTATVAATYYSVASVASPKSVSSVIQNIDYATLIDDAEIDSEAINEFVKSPEMKDFLDDFSKGMMNGVYGKEEFNAEKLKEIFDEHRDSILEAAKEMGEIEITPEEFSETIETIMTENADEINDSLSELQDSTAPAATALEVIGKSLDITTIILVILFFAILLGLIYLLRRRNYGGFIWIAVCMGDTGINLAEIYLIIKLFLPDLLQAELGTGSFEANFANQILSVSDKNFIIFIAVAFFIMAAAIVSAIVFKKNAKAKQIEIES